MTAWLEEATRFLNLARDDLDAFRVLAADPRIRPRIALFHAQQAAEKSLKAMLFAKRVEFRRTHDLLELTESLRRAGVVLDVRLEKLVRLTPYAVQSRYDTNDADPMPVGEAEEIAAALLDLAVAEVAKAGT